MRKFSRNYLEQCDADPESYDWKRPFRKVSCADLFYAAQEAHTECDEEAQVFVRTA